MSYPVMPVLPISMQRGLNKTPVFNTYFQKTAANRGNVSVSTTPFASWAFEFDMDKIGSNEVDATSVLAQFFGTLMACQGRALLFSWTDPQDSTVAQTTGVMLNVTPAAASPMSQTGDGSSKKFQLARLIGGAGIDVLQNVSVTSLYVNGVLKSAGTDYSIDSKGVLTFVSAPANSASLAWSGTFSLLCRFDEDTIDATRVFTVNSGADLWDIRSIKWTSEFV